MTNGITLYSGGNSEDISNVLEFSFYKEMYTPYTQLSVSFIANNISPADAKGVRLWVNGVNVHHGFIDSFRIVSENGVRKGYIRSRGFTAQYTENQLVPGLYTRVTINDLLDNHITIPYVTHESNTSESYIYVKSGSNIWDGVVNIAYKLLGKYPYIRGTNCVMFSRSSDAKVVDYTNSSLLAEGSELDTRKAASFFSMADISDQYGSYTASETLATDRDIVRERYFELDRRFLYDPQQGVDFRDKMSVRGIQNRFVTYKGYRSEDILDVARFGDNTRDITSVRISGKSSGIFTTVGMYSDRFVNTAV